MQYATWHEGDIAGHLQLKVKCYGKGLCNKCYEKQRRAAAANHEVTEELVRNQHSMRHFHVYKRSLNNYSWWVIELLSGGTFFIHLPSFFASFYTVFLIFSFRQLQGDKLHHKGG